MAFTVEDFEDLLRLLYERPEWQERLRRVILPPELFELPRIAQELADANRAERERVARLEAEQQATRQELREGFAQTGERLDRVETDLAAFRTETNERFDRMDQRLDGMDQRFDGMDQRFDRMDARLLQLSNDVGVIKGTGMEERFRARGSWFRHLIPNPIVLAATDVAQLLDAEVAAGHLLSGDARRVERADLVMRSAETETAQYLLVEVSWLVEERDVRRALERARLLRKAGYEVQAAVAGTRIQDDARALAERIGVGRVIEEELEDEERAADDQG